MVINKSKTFANLLGDYSKSASLFVLFPYAIQCFLLLNLMRVLIASHSTENMFHVP